MFPICFHQTFQCVWKPYIYDFKREFPFSSLVVTSIMDVDEALTHLGKFNRWQISKYILTCMSVTVSGCWHMMVIVFTGEFMTRVTISYTILKISHSCQHSQKQSAHWALDVTAQVVPCWLGSWLNCNLWLVLSQTQKLKSHLSGGSGPPYDWDDDIVAVHRG